MRLQVESKMVSIPSDPSETSAGFNGAGAGQAAQEPLRGRGAS